MLGKRATIVVRLIALMVIGVVSATLTALSEESAEKPAEGKQPRIETVETTSAELLETAVGKPDINRIATEIIEDYEKKLAILNQSCREKAKASIERQGALMEELNEMYKSGNVYDKVRAEKLHEEIRNLDFEIYQIHLWREEQGKLLEQERQRREQELAENYLEKYVPKEIVFLPWGSGKGEAGVREVEWVVQGIEAKPFRFGPARIEVDKDGSVYIWNQVWGKLPDWQKEVRRIDNPYVHKYVKDETTIEKYKYGGSIPLKTDEKELLLFEGEIKSEYRYETYAMKGGERLGLRVINDRTGTIEKEIDFCGMDDGETYAVSSTWDDQEGNIYVLKDRTTAGAGVNDLEVYKYGKDGTLLAKVQLLLDLPWISQQGDRLYGQKNNVRVDRDGNIYQLLLKEDGAHVVKWERK